jgi:hypothetical protein
MLDRDEDFARALLSEGPVARYSASLTRFGQLVGTWDARGTRLDEATGEWTERHFTWMVAFILGGHGVQDLEVVQSSHDPKVQDPKSQDPELTEITEAAETRQAAETAEARGTAETFETIATALRVYDPVAGAVRVSFASPVSNQYCNLIAVDWHDGIRQDGTQNDGRPIRWNFTSIADYHYSWEGWVSNDDGASWELVEHIDGTRIG